MELIDLYKKWMETEKLSNVGLCNSLPQTYWKTLILFMPSNDEMLELIEEGFDQVFWASGLPADHRKEERGFTELRQTIVSLICAMHDEI